METKQMINNAIGSTVVKSAPVGSVALATMWGITLSDWTLIIAIIVGVCQILYTIMATWVKWKNRNNKGE